MIATGVCYGVVDSAFVSKGHLVTPSSPPHKVMSITTKVITIASKDQFASATVCAQNACRGHVQTRRVATTMRDRTNVLINVIKTW